MTCVSVASRSNVFKKRRLSLDGYEGTHRANCESSLVDHPEQVSVRPIEGEQMTVFELRLAQSDVGRVIGKEGRTATSIRTIVSAAGMKLKKRFTLEILE